MDISNADASQLQNLETELSSQYQALQKANLQLDLTRGKPCTEQLCLSNELDGILDGNYYDAHGIDVRNYGGLTGLREARELCAAMLGSEPENTVIGGNGSLSLMYQIVEFALNYGFKYGFKDNEPSGQPWKLRGEVNFLCPVPGYDRHFAICEHLGIGMIPVPMTASGPDMEIVEKLVQTDPSIVGMWCVPRFSNPCGTVYSAAVVERIAGLGQLAAPGFLVLWDNAYSVHTLYDNAPQLTDINGFLDQGHAGDHVVQFGSTSKITFAGAGMAFLATSPANVTALTNHLGFSTIGPDKVNQLRQVRFLSDMEGVHRHMRRQAEIIRPRFERVLALLDEGLGQSGMGSWSTPRGGYFVMFNSLPGLAKTIVDMAAAIGVKLTPAGATWPYGEDPNDSDVRLAPTFPSLDEVETATRAFILCVKLASVRQSLALGRS